MLAPRDLTTIKSEIKKLEYAREHCTDSGIRKLIDGSSAITPKPAIDYHLKTGQRD
jgi:hypothetical protein